MMQAPTSDFDLSLLQRILLATDGTVTNLIALYTGEEIRVKKLRQEILKEIAPPELRCAEPIRLLRREILLAGASKNFLYANSVFAFERFSKSIQDDLIATDRPIGLLWKQERLETYREVVEQVIEPCPNIASHFELTADERFVSRTYLIHHGGKPLGSITEKWPVAWFRDQLQNS
jgi:chorismate-pyruvate lyase